MSLEMTRRAFLGFVAAVPALAKAATMEGWATPEELKEAEPLIETPSIGGERAFWINKRRIDGHKSMVIKVHSSEPVVYNHGLLISQPRYSHTTIEAEWYIDRKTWAMAQYTRELIASRERVEVDCRLGNHLYSLEALVTSHQMHMGADHSTLRLGFHGRPKGDFE